VQAKFPDLGEGALLSGVRLQMMLVFRQAEAELNIAHALPKGASAA
jgi:hypothetical protein